MMLDPLFVAAVLEGFEGTLSEVVERVDCPKLRASLDTLLNQIIGLRISIEQTADELATRN
jgi:hypothetical protein